MIISHIAIGDRFAFAQAHADAIMGPRSTEQAPVRESVTPTSKHRPRKKASR